MELDELTFNRLKSLPPLPEGYVRLVHRCKNESLTGESKTDSITRNGLVFNRQVAGIQPSERGGTYLYPSSMVSVYSQKQFWDSLRKDDFACFDDSKYADTKIIFDMPLEEFAFLQKFGRFFYGKIDSKYIVGVIPNINGSNRNLMLPQSYIDKAEHISTTNRHHTPVEPNNLKQMVTDLYNKSYSHQEKNSFMQKVYTIIDRVKKEIKDSLGYNSQSRTSATKDSKNFLSIKCQNTVLSKSTRN